MAKALRTAANGNTTHQQRIQEEFGRATAEEEARNRPIRGRQLLLIVHAYYRTNEELGTQYGPRHIYMVKCVNDKRLDAFLNEWHTTIARIPKTVDPDILREHLFHQMRSCACMEHALRNYDAASRGERHRTYEYLLEQANRQIALRRQRENDAAIEARLTGRAAPAAPAPTRTHCAQWVNKGNCSMHEKTERVLVATLSPITLLLLVLVLLPLRTRRVRARGKARTKEAPPPLGERVERVEMLLRLLGEMLR